MTEGRTNDEDAKDLEGGGHAALFAYVGVADLTDWRTVALRLASQYAPELLKGVDYGRPIAAPKKVGRPEKWTPERKWMLLVFIEMVREAARNGVIRADLVTNTAICRFIAGNYPETQWIRDALDLKPGTTAETLDNLRRLAIKQEQRPAANENSP